MFCQFTERIYRSSHLSRKLHLLANSPPRMSPPSAHVPASRPPGSGSLDSHCKWPGRPPSAAHVLAACLYNASAAHVLASPPLTQRMSVLAGSAAHVPASPPSRHASATPVPATATKDHVVFDSKKLFDKKSEILIKNSLTDTVAMRTLLFMSSLHFSHGGLST